MISKKTSDGSLTDNGKQGQQTAALFPMKPSKTKFTIKRKQNKRMAYFIC